MPTAKQLLAAYLRSDEVERRRFERAAGLQRRRCVEDRADRIEARNRAVHAIVRARGGLPKGSPRKQRFFWLGVLAALEAAEPGLTYRGRPPADVDTASSAKLAGERITARGLRRSYLPWRRAHPDPDAESAAAARVFPEVSRPSRQSGRNRLVG